MSPRPERGWSVLSSHQTFEGDRCVDLFRRPDGTFGYLEFRRDPEDIGAWTVVGNFSERGFRTEGDALAGAVGAVAWLGPLLAD